MSRIDQEKAMKGSQKQLQLLVNRHPDVLDDLLLPRLQLSNRDTITWLSPIKEDGYAEYRDEDFLELLSIRLENRSLGLFWPHGGPVWDGLAKTSRGDVILVEAKSHVPELVSSCQASPQSLKLIEDSQAETAKFYHATRPGNWTHGYYQYANRLAHFHLLRHLNGIQAWLCFVYFVNDHEMSGPQSSTEWQSEIGAVHKHLGIAEESLRPYVVDVFPDVMAYNKQKR